MNKEETAVLTQRAAVSLKGERDHDTAVVTVACRYHKVDTPHNGPDRRIDDEKRKILGTPPHCPSIILQNNFFVNIQNAQMMAQKFFLSNNTGLDDGLCIPRVIVM